MELMKWVLVDRSKGAKTADGSTLSHAALARIAEAVSRQINDDFAPEWGTQAHIRVAANEHDIRPGESVFGLEASLPRQPDASAFHDIDKTGVAFALCAVTTCPNLYGKDGISVDISHELLETAGDLGVNLYADDGHGTLHAIEVCDAVEMQVYTKTCEDGTQVAVSNWLLRSWFTPGRAGPYDFMSKAGLPGAIAPPGPLKTAPGQGGNYQILCKAGAEKQVFALQAQDPSPHIHGTRRKGGTPHWSSRAARRITQIEKLGGAR